MTAKPKSVALHYYNVGFGDCLLLELAYANESRFVLVDCGTTSAPGKQDAGELLLRVALDVEKRCGGKLHAVVATHRHKDHVEGFRRKKGGKGPGDVFLRCKPDVVLLPWTEDPDAAVDATRPTTALKGSAISARKLSGMQSAASGVLAEVERLGASIPKSTASRLAMLGVDNARLDDAAIVGGKGLANANPLETLREMGARSPSKRCRYVCHGMPSGLEAVLPGVKVRVLGPPSIEQHSAVLKQREKDDAEYWHLLGFAGERSSGKPRPFRGASVLAHPAPEHRWIVRQLRRLRAQQLYEVVRTVDDALNNTSLILLFQIGKTKLLFPGDAQIENWEYALAKNAKLLADVRLYKVGHHGSLNATPKSLWNAFTRKKGGAGPGDLVSVCSTKSGVHGDANEVPRKKLVDELESKSELRDTRTLSRKKKLSESVVIPL